MTLLSTSWVESLNIRDQSIGLLKEGEETDRSTTGGEEIDHSTTEDRRGGASHHLGPADPSVGFVNWQGAALPCTTGTRLELATCSLGAT